MMSTVDRNPFLSSKESSDSWYAWLTEPYKEGWTHLKKAFGPVNELREINLTNPSRSETKGTKLFNLAHRIKFIGLAIPLLIPVINIFPLAYIVNQIYIKLFFNKVVEKDSKKIEEINKNLISQDPLLNENPQKFEENIKKPISQDITLNGISAKEEKVEENSENKIDEDPLLNEKSEEEKEKREVAATTIQKIFRRRIKKKSNQDYKPNLDLIRNLPSERFIPGELAQESALFKGHWPLHPTKPPKSEISIPFIERTVRRLLEYNRKDEVLRLANILFATPHGLDLKDELQKLRKLTRDNFSCEPENIVETFMNAVKAWRTKDGYGVRLVNKNLFKKRLYNPQRKLFKEQNCEEIVFISHGGGYTNIKEFLSGKNKGYGLEDGGVGIQVSLMLNERDKGYSQRSKDYFDTPAILTGHIARKYLNLAPGYPYEAGIVQENAKHLKNLKITCVEKPYWEDPDLYKSIDHFIEEVPCAELELKVV